MGFIELFDALSIKVVPRELKQHVYVQAVAATILQPCDKMLKAACKMEAVFRMEVVFRPALLDNFDNWHIFENDAQIVNFFWLICRNSLFATLNDKNIQSWGT